jgi:hypothetical protein
VKKNQEVNEKAKKERIGNILSRSTRKEQYREKYLKNKKCENGDKKDKRLERYQAAQRKVHQDLVEHTRESHNYQNNLMQELEQRVEAKKQRERAKSAHHYSSIQNQK